ncbi:TPA: endonuclease NucS domain-containing protein [Vibrio diabolicus]
MNENEIRDYISSRLHLVEDGLELVDKEHYLKNDHGASGFLDIFVRSKTGQLVIIEIKRTNSAAREAIQELYKYAALIRSRYLVKNVDYKLLVLSVEWHELRTPFSEFVKHAPYEVSGGEIVLNEKGEVTEINEIAVIEPPAQRQISRRQFLWRFQDKKSLEKGLSVLSKHMVNAGLKDFVFVESQSTELFLTGKFFLYFAQQELSLSEYDLLIYNQMPLEEYKEYKAKISELSEYVDKVGESADDVWITDYSRIYSEISSDHSEIAYPEKAADWFAKDKQVNIKVHRFGRFVDEHIDDDVIISEIIGEEGLSDYKLDLTAQLSSRPQLDALIRAIDNVFYFNNDWRSCVKDLIAYAERSNSVAIHVSTFSNEDILRTIAGLAFGYTGFLPQLKVEITRSNGESEVFFGFPEWDGTAPNFDKIIESYFENKTGYFLSHHFGENRASNIDVMNDLGLQYSVFSQQGDSVSRIRVQGSSISFSPKPIKGSIPSLISENHDEVKKIVEMFFQMDSGFRNIIGSWLEDEGLI